ncbi:hypothetical protein AAG570_006187 [Ranatra chinensis]|uniref:Tim44-like domain-containing protein n=1 Tax=Ranatra chinensis TaxID=642074 RepID=A0ABD0XXM9_9HEMI
MLAPSKQSIGAAELNEGSARTTFFRAVINPGEGGNEEATRVITGSTRKGCLVETTEPERDATEIRDSSSEIFEDGVVFGVEPIRQWKHFLLMKGFHRFWGGKKGFEILAEQLHWISHIKKFMKKLREDLERKKLAEEKEKFKESSLLRKNVDAYKNGRCDPNSAEPPKGTLAMGQNNPAGKQDETQAEASDIKDSNPAMGLVNTLAVSRPPSLFPPDLPPFWTANPTLWLIQVMTTFVTSCESSQVNRFNPVVRSIVDLDKTGSFLMDKVRELVEGIKDGIVGMQPSPATDKKLRPRKDSTKCNENTSLGDFKPVGDTLVGKLCGHLTKHGPALPFAMTKVGLSDPAFSVEGFLDECKRDIIPNILGAQLANNMDLVQDWCTGQALAWSKRIIMEDAERGLVSFSRLLSVEDLEVLSGGVSERGTELVIRFNTTQTFCMKDGAGEVVEGEEDEEIKVGYIWTLRRDVKETDRKAAWRLSVFMVTLPQ